ncbi:hypothetical protein A3SI_13447 [Nitritalea halalkaliphila LW7]|uniref:Uncharacterized protein n=1 Tax=Nitritalea halalkaliphila LW7 TaxID=1189621 RepID=I5C0R1_9BACT|nr:hypothetical protein [Nitritalea halalkaliphila]EIM75413.1 hypothetical protein A3SI_13447 [Nitritalea halalkaliphila LW7]
MRHLTDIELQEVRKEITRKEISSAEILMEIYDHYISHLQEFPEEEFNEQLFELDQKFTYAYCHALQAKFKKAAHADISKTQWQVLRSYFCLGRWMYFVGFLAMAIYLSTYFQTVEEAKLIILLPFILLFGFQLYYGYQSYKHMKPIRQNFKGIGIPIQSSLAGFFENRASLPGMFIYAFISFPALFFNWEPTKVIAPQVAAVFTVLITLYALSLIEVWKIKSKTALV